MTGYRLVFQRLEPEGPAYANIVAPGDGVLGVVYPASAATLERMDSFEHGYDRLAVRVTAQDGAAIAAVAYIVRPAATVQLGVPSAAYLQTILRGAREHGLPDDYVDAVATIASAPGSRRVH